MFWFKTMKKYNAQIHSLMLDIVNHRKLFEAFRNYIEISDRDLATLEMLIKAKAHKQVRKCAKKGAKKCRTK